MTEFRHPNIERPPNPPLLKGGEGGFMVFIFRGWPNRPWAICLELEIWLLRFSLGYLFSDRIFEFRQIRIYSINS
jgi:hypothetical protein